MTLKELESSASKGHEMPEGLSLPEQTYYLGLMSLYRSYHSKVISLEQAKKDKAKLKQAFSHANTEFEKYRMLTEARLEASKRSELEKGEVLKGILLGGHPYTLLLRLAHCLGVATGDRVYFEQCKKDVRLICDHVDTLEPSEEIRQLEELQERLHAAAELEDDLHAKARIQAAVNQNDLRLKYLKGDE